MDAVEPLKEYWATFVGVVAANGLAASVCEFVSEIQPFSLAQNLESLNARTEGISTRNKHESLFIAVKSTYLHSAIIWIEQYLC